MLGGAGDGEGVRQHVEPRRWRPAPRMCRTGRFVSAPGPRIAPPVEDAVNFDERGLVPCVIQDWRSGEVLTLAYMNAEALRLSRETGELHLWSRSRAGAVAQGRDIGQHAGGQGAALRLRRRRGARAGRARRPGLPHGRAHVLLLRRPDRRAPRGAARARAHARRARREPAPRAPTPPSCSPTRRSSARRCRRRPRRSPAPRARSPTSAWPRRPPTCSTTWPCCCSSRGLSLADAEEVLLGRRR